MRVFLSATITALCFASTAAWGGGCSGTLGMTGCSFPQGPTTVPPSANPRPAGPDPSSHVPMPGPRPPTDRGKTPPGTIAQ